LISAGVSSLFFSWRTGPVLDVGLDVVLDVGAGPQPRGPQALTKASVRRADRTSCV
jgi:hypothetical protein